jgi:transcription elongation factor GreA
MPRNPGEEPSAVLTKNAFDRLKGELEELRTNGRTMMADRLQHARELGDISENAEYDAAKNEQGLMEARIRELERLLKDVDIVEGPQHTEEAGPGLVVTLRPVDDDEPEDEKYLLAVSKEERADGVRTVSVDSPLGQAIAGKRVGQRVSYEAPGGKFTYEVVDLAPRA